MTLTRNLALLSMACLAGCAMAHLKPTRFRTMQPQGALARLEQSIAQHAGGVASKEANGRVLSKWTRTMFRYGEGKKIAYRITGAVLNNSADGSADVSLVMDAYTCPEETLATVDPAKDCQHIDGPVPQVLADRFRATSEAIRDGVFREK